MNPLPKKLQQEAESSPYAGRWVALLKGQVVAQGTSPEQARKAAKAARPKEDAEIVFMPASKSIQLPQILERISALIPESEAVYLVGGALRNVLLQRETADFDFVLAEDAIPLAKKVANAMGGAFYVLDQVRGAGRVLLTQDQRSIKLDFVKMLGPDIEADLKARDFTINAMAIEIHHPEALIDPLGGAADLHAGHLRACSSEALDQDPIRVIRAVRMAASFELKIDETTRAKMKAASKQLSSISIERLRDEIFRLLSAPKLAASFRALEMLGALDELFPELLVQKEKGLWELALRRFTELEQLLTLLGRDYPEEGAGDLHSGLITLRLGRYRQQISEYMAVEEVQDRPHSALFALASLYFESEDGDLRGNPDVISRRLAALRLSNHEMESLRRIHAEQHRLTAPLKIGEPPDRRAIYRFFLAAGKEGIDCSLLSIAHLLASRGAELSQKALDSHLEVIRSLLGAYWEAYDEIISPAPLLNGNDLTSEFDLQPGARIGEILETLREAQAAGEVNTKKEALALATRLIQS